MRIKLAQISFWIIAAAFSLNALAAYDVLGGIPLSWFAHVIVIVSLFSSTRFLGRLRHAPGIGIFLGLLLYSVAISISNYGPTTNAQPTTPYWIFLALRYAENFGFLAVFSISLYYRQRKDDERIELFIVNLGAIVAIYAVYCYFAQILGLWEIPRTRMGTGGQDYSLEAVRFSFDVHRALGSFREPSHLAEWLITPILIAFFGLERRRLNQAAIMMVALVLTLSLLGIVSIIAAFAIYASMGSSAKSVRSTLLGIAALIVCGTAIYIAAPSYVQHFLSRVGALATDGVSGSSRSAIAEYVVNQPPPFLGYGIGNSNLIFSDYRGIELVSGHVSWFWEIYMSLGVPGLVLLAAYLVNLLLFVLNGRKGDAAKKPYLLALLVAWLMLFVGHAATPPLMFGLALCIMTRRQPNGHTHN